MTMTETPLSLSVERRLPAPPEQVFDAWLTPDMLTRFICPQPHIRTIAAKTDPRVGGGFELTMATDDKEMPFTGVYQEVDRPNRLVFTWMGPFSAEGSTVTLDLRAVSGGTHLTLTHVNFVSPDSRDSHINGWTSILQTLDDVLA